MKLSLTWICLLLLTFTGFYFNSGWLPFLLSAIKCFLVLLVFMDLRKEYWPWILTTGIVFLLPMFIF